jgi:NAD(P)H-hydrate epimerase
VISLDVPSGVDATSGQTPGSHVRASQTLTLALPKTGLDVVGVGRLTLADIGIPVGVYKSVGLEIPETLFTAGQIVGLTPNTSPP